ncbi:uncharacterized protein LOC105779065 [Gossypium raimondii]|uniref:uncharacterized protein LOC105779065 n=1 Tax=Gossypium raimondii TaxID=29730 RepID=UPI00063AE157|nr:uncharacterized protein LOC105779065 [Gossypium raimondii]
MWGMDVIGPILPKASNGHRFIFVVIDYFTKWVEAASSIAEVCGQFKIKHHNSSPYRSKMNGAVEAANKDIKKIVGKMTETSRDWHEKLPFALLAYRTSIRTSTGATPFSLVYGMEAVLPIEVEIPSLRVLTELHLDEAEWVQSRYDQLNLIEGKRLKAIQHGQMYQKRMMRAYNKKVRPRELHEGDLAFSGGALILAEMDGKNLPNPVNSDSVKRGLRKLYGEIQAEISGAHVHSFYIEFVVNMFPSTTTTYKLSFAFAFALPNQWPCKYHPSASHVDRHIPSFMQDSGPKASFSSLPPPTVAINKCHCPT